MTCESCKEKPATVHLTDISPKGKKEVHLCEACAKNHNQPLKPLILKPHLDFNDLLGGLVGAHLGKGEGESGSACPKCGITYQEFRAGGRLGCPHDYVAFKKGLVPLLERIHGGSVHAGKVPSQLGQRMSREKEYSQLQQELNKAVASEEYEKAAKLRDRLKQIKDQREHE